MKTAIVTGASSGIGKAIAQSLIKTGYKVIGFGRKFDDSLSNSSDMLQQIELDLLDTNKLEQTIKAIRKENDIAVLVNCAGVAYYGLFEQISISDIQKMVRTNLELPMILTQLLLRDLKKNKGFVINISSVTATSSNPHGVAYGATKAGLSSFSKSLFDEARKYGIKVCDIKPDMTDTNLYRNANFTCDPSACLAPADVAAAVEYLLSAGNGVVVNEITLKPQLHRIQRK
ncbi:MAG: SDR family NAD(P)-dependent oxidoreductase [Pseudobutyrivibrio sp.]|nr:SDR family NAD(P)-dependent oxidoreductase [Pseudobutyrivibrio sp.]